MNNQKKIAIIMGSDSDYERLGGAFDIFKKFDVEFTAHVMSAHRTPNAAHNFATTARENGYGVLIAAAGLAAHLGGVLAANTTLPVIGIPVENGALKGLDALLATVQMPSGIPVATVGISNATNAALLAIQMLALSNDVLADKLVEYKKEMVEVVEQKNIKLQGKLND